MAEKKTAKTVTAEPGVMDGVKKSLGRAADMTSLRLKLRKTQARRKEAYNRLGQLAYAKYRPRETAVPDDIENAIATTVKEITALSHEITELSMRLEIMKVSK